MLGHGMQRSVGVWDAGAGTLELLHGPSQSANVLVKSRPVDWGCIKNSRTTRLGSLPVVDRKWHG